jgi:hypothetical protein
MVDVREQEPRARLVGVSPDGVDLGLGLGE